MNTTARNAAVTGVELDHGEFVPACPGSRQARVTVTVPGLDPVVLVVLRPVPSDRPWGHQAVAAVRAYRAGAAVTDHRPGFGRLHDWLAVHDNYQDLNRAWAEHRAAALAPQTATSEKAATRLARLRAAWPHPDTPVTARRDWNSPRRAVYRLGDLGGLHWSQTSGGQGHRANRPYVHAYVSCLSALGGTVAHSCTHGPAPHRIKICLTAIDNGGTRSRLTRHLRALATDTPVLTA
ncbi:hypothetical protein [Actinosynnema sp. NPDC023587]|uniref:hypothetical protein n=1 Tax=Actinosynnema sp. NPDC023587 TaxID=3154695 RepID=UPI0033E20F36